MPRSGQAEVAVYDVRGRRVRSLHRAEVEAGAHRFAWDGRDASGQLVDAGIYIVQLRSADATASAMVVRFR